MFEFNWDKWEYFLFICCTLPEIRISTQQTHNLYPTLLLKSLIHTPFSLHYIYLYSSFYFIPRVFSFLFFSTHSFSHFPVTIFSPLLYICKYCWECNGFDFDQCLVISRWVFFSESNGWCFLSLHWKFQFDEGGEVKSEEVLFGFVKFGLMMELFRFHKALMMVCLVYQNLNLSWSLNQEGIFVFFYV